jgi:hypothetical protein
VRVGNEDHLHRRVAALQNLLGALDQRFHRHAVIDGVDLAKPEMGIDTDFITHLSAEEAPDGETDAFAQDIPQGHFNSSHRARADHADAPKAVLVHDAQQLLDVAGITADDQGRQILDCPRHGTGLPFERRLAPAIESRLIGVDTHKDPVPHLCIDDERPYSSYLHRTVPEGVGIACGSKDMLARSVWPGASTASPPRPAMLCAFAA